MKIPTARQEPEHSDEHHTEEGELDTSWFRIDLGPALRGEIHRPEPSVLRRDDGGALFYPGRVNGVHGDSGDGKSWAADIACAQELEAGHHVVWLDFEDDETTIVERLRDVLGVGADAIRERLHYYRPTSPMDDTAVTHIAAEVVAHGVTLVVLDSLGEAFALEGINEDRDDEVAPWYRRVARRLADLGPAVVLIDHTTKAKDNKLFPSGSKRKRAAISGASYLLDAPRSMTREHGGRLRLTCAKDRHGSYRRGEVAAVIDFAVYPDGGYSVKVWPPMTGEQKAEDQRLLVAARAAVRAAKEAGKPLSGRLLAELMKVKAGSELKRAGIEYAVNAGALSAEAGPRNSTMHAYVSELMDPES